MNYSTYLPNIDIEGGMARVMGNSKLYLRLVEKFKGAKMAADILNAIEEADAEKIISTAHALRGTAANLGFIVVQEVSGEIEDLTKAEQDVSHLREPLNDAITTLNDSIERLLGA